MHLGVRAQPNLKTLSLTPRLWTDNNLQTSLTLGRLRERALSAPGPAAPDWGSESARERPSLLLTGPLDCPAAHAAGGWAAARRGRPRRALAPRPGGVRRAAAAGARRRRRQGRRLLGLRTARRGGGAGRRAGGLRAGLRPGVLPLPGGLRLPDQRRGAPALRLGRRRRAGHAGGRRAAAAAHGAAARGGLPRPDGGQRARRARRGLGGGRRGWRVGGLLGAGLRGPQPRPAPGAARGRLRAGALALVAAAVVLRGAGGLQVLPGLHGLRLARLRGPAGRGGGRAGGALPAVDPRGARGLPGVPAAGLLGAVARGDAAAAGGALRHLRAGAAVLRGAVPRQPLPERAPRLVRSGRAVRAVGKGQFRF